MELIIKLKKATSGFWKGGAKRIFSWGIDGKPQKDKHGYFIKIGSWEANDWFNIGCGKSKVQTNRQILTNAKTKLLKSLAKNGHAVESAIIISNEV